MRRRQIGREGDEEPDTERHRQKEIEWGIKAGPGAAEAICKWGHMASAEREPIRGSGAKPPAESRGRAPGQGVRGAKPP